MYEIENTCEYKNILCSCPEVHIYSKTVRSNLTRKILNMVSFSFFIHEGSSQTNGIPLSSNSLQSEAHLPKATITGSYVPWTERFGIFSP